MDDFEKELAALSAEPVSPEVSQAISEIKPQKPDSWTTKAVDLISSGFQSTEGRPFDWQNVGESAAIGAGIGAGMGAFAGPGGAALGAGSGAISGAAGGLAGEIAATMGASPVTQFGAEVVGGGIPKALQKIGGATVASLAKVGSYKTGRAIGTLTPETKFSQDEINAVIKAKEKAFGPATFKGLYSTNNIDELQATIKNQYGLVGNEQASDILRKNLYDNLENLKSQVTNIEVTTSPAKYSSLGLQVKPKESEVLSIPNVFRTSPEYKQLIDEVDALVERTHMTTGEAANLKKIVGNELSKNPLVAEQARNDLYNLIQNGGVYTVAKKGAEAETKTKIPEDARKKLVEYFDKYLERTVGGPQYSRLKEIERQEFVAEARDSIPTMLSSKFKKQDDAYKAALANIAQSPEGKQEFAQALNQHFLKFGEEQVGKGGKVVGMQTTPQNLIQELHRLEPAIIQSKVMSKEAINNVYKKFESIPSSVSLAKRNAIAWEIGKAALTGTLASEIATKNPLDIFFK